MSELFERRVPQWTAVYIGAGWGLVQFIAFIEERYLISPHWTDLALLSLGLLLPSVVLYTYNHGRPGADRMQRSEKVGIPLNVALAGMVLWLVFGNKDLGAMTTAVTVTGANGETIERELAKPEFRRRIALFGFDLPSASDTAWVASAADIAMQFDLAQDGWLDVRTMPHFVQRMRESGYEPGQPIPVALKKQIADDLNLTHFTQGAVEETADGFRVRLGLYDVDTGRELTEREYAGADLLALIDSASLGLRRDLELPAAHLDQVEDMAVSERLTANREALRAFARAWAASHNNDWAAVNAHAAEAVELDATFAAAALALFQARMYTSDHEGSMQALALASRHVYRLPERMQFFVRAGQYQMQQQSERAIGVLETAAQLYPDDIEPRAMLGLLLPQADRKRDAIGHLEEVLRIDPGQIDQLLTIGSLYRELGEYDSAVAAYGRFSDAAPDRAEGLRAVGEIQALRGAHEDARRQFERALLLEPGNVEVLIAIARLAQDIGDFDDARRQLGAAEAAARTPQARFSVAEATARLSRTLGQPLDAHHRLVRSLDHASEFLPPLIVQVFRMMSLKPLAEAGRADEAHAILAEIAPQLAGPFAAMTAIGAVGIEMGKAEPDAARIEAEAARIEQLIATAGWEMLRPDLLNTQGFAAELRGDYAAAVRSYRTQLELDPSDAGPRVDLARALRLSGDLPAAARELALVLESKPADPLARYELAMVHDQAGRADDAVTELRRTLEIWRSAEPAYVPAARARAALDRLLAAAPAGDRR